MNTGWVDERFLPEVIQIGLAVFISKTAKQLGNYSSYVCPRINTKLSGYSKTF